jgi:hypothetical protein
MLAPLARTPAPPDRWTELATKAIFAEVGHFAAPPKALRTRKRFPFRGSDLDRPLSGFESSRLLRQIACESDEERRVFGWLEKSPDVRWYQEQPLAVPYVFEGRRACYFPDAVVLDRAGRLIVIEVKPLFMMFRLDVLAKAIAALEYLGTRGMGYLLIDSRGRTLADMAQRPHDPNVVETMESLFEHGPVGFRTVRNAMRMWSGGFDLPSFVSMVVNRDWAVSNGPAVLISRLPAGLSFRPLCERARGLR